MDKDDAAKQLVEHHFAVEPDLHTVYRIVNEREDEPDEPIKLLEINAATVETGTIEIFGFGPTDELPFSVYIAEITPEELEQLRKQQSRLPPGWDLSKARKFPRPQAAE